MMRLLLLLASLSLVRGQLSWSKLIDEEAAFAMDRNSVPPPRMGHALGHHNGKQLLILFGGESSSGNKMGDTWIYFLTNNSWVNLDSIQQNSAKPQARSHSVFGVIETYNIFVLAYGAGTNSDYNDVWTLDLNSWTWFELSPQGNKPESRYGMFGGVIYGASNEFWIGGGFTTLTSDPRVYRPNIDIHRLNFNAAQSASWEKLYSNPSPGNQYNPFVPHGRAYAASAVVTADKMVIFGGCLSGGTGGGPCPAEDVWTFDEKSNEWSQMVSCPSPRSGAVMVPFTSLSGRVLLYGGTYGVNQIIGIGDYPLAELYLLDLNGAVDKQWKRYRSTGDQGSFPGRRHSHAMAAGGNGTVYLFGGVSVGPSEYLNDLWRLSGSVDNTQELTPTCEHLQFSYGHLHGLFMSLACGILLPLGFLIARYYRSKGILWFVLHLVCQISAVVLTIIGFIIIFATSQNPTPLYPHGIIGIVVMVLLLQQVFNGIIRPRVKRERKKKSAYRIFWEYYHKISGVFTIILGFLQVTLGLFLVIPPVAVWAVWIAIFGLWVLAILLHEIVKWIRYFVDRKNKSKRQQTEFSMKTY